MLPLQKILFWFFLWLSLLRGGIIVAQQKQLLYEQYLPHYDVSLLTANDGLSQGSVYFMYRDSRDFMWFSSYEGLNRFDGKHFKVFLPNKNNKTNIKGGVIYGITEDKLGNLWVGTEECLNKFDRNTETFSAIQTYNNTFQKVHPIYGDSSHILYVGSNEGLVSYDFNTNKKEFLSKEIIINNNYFQVFSAHRNSKGEIWLRSYTNERLGIQRFNVQTKKIDYFFSNHKDNIYGSATHIFNFCFDKLNDDVLWLGTKNGLMRFNVSNQVLESFYCPFIDFKSSYIHDMKQDSKGNIWIATDTDGLVIFSQSTKTFQKFQKDNPYSNATTRYVVSTLFADHAKDIMWANIESLGLLKISASSTLFQSYHHEPLNPRSMGCNSVRCFVQDNKNRIWIGTMGCGINVYDPKNQQFSRPFAKQIPTDNIFQMRRDGNHNIWIATHEGLMLYDENSEQFQLFKNILPNVNTFNANTIQDISVISNSQILLSTDAGLFLFDSHKKQFEQVKYAENISPIILYYDDKKNIIIVGTDNGFHAFKLQNQQLIPLYAGLKGYEVLSCLKYNDKLWLGTNKGLFEIDTLFNIQKNYMVEDGLPSNNIYGCIADNTGSLWLSSNRGLSCFNITTHTFKNFTPKHGLQGYEYNIKGAYKATDGKLYFGGVEGFDAFKPDSLYEKPYTFPVRLIDLKINSNKLISDTVISEKKHITLNHNQNTIQFFFQAFDYYSNGDNKYRYKLMPFQKDWAYSDVNNVTYAQLPSGSYTFIVEAATTIDSWTGEKAILNIYIHPSFWETWWFRTIIAAILFSIGYLMYRFRQTRLDMQRREENFQRRLAETEMAALRSQMNPHFIFNVLNSINDYMLNHNTVEASQYLTDFSKLIRLVLENSRSEKVTLANEIIALDLYMRFEQLRFEEKLKYSINIDHTIDMQYTKIPPLLIQPYVENAIWHGLMHRVEGGKVTINITQQNENLLHVEIEDDGIGRAAANELKSKSAVKKKSFGMTITSERIQLVNEIFKTNTKVTIHDLVDTEGVASGTKVVIEIPC